MLIRGSVEHIVRPELREHLFHALLLRDARHHRVHLDLRPLFPHHQPNFVLRRLSLVNEHHLRRRKLCYLAHHLTADAASRTRNQNLLSFQHLAHALQVHLDLIAWQQVIDAHLFQSDAVRGNTLGISLRHEYFHAGIRQDALQLLIIAEFRIPLRRNQHSPDAIARQHLVEF